MRTSVLRLFLCAGRLGTVEAFALLTVPGWAAAAAVSPASLCSAAWRPLGFLELRHRFFMLAAA